MAAASPHLLRSLTTISTPHPRALAHAFLTSDQAFRSWYVPFFQIPVIPELVFCAKDGMTAVNLLQQAGLPLPVCRAICTSTSADSRGTRRGDQLVPRLPACPSLSLATPSVSTPTMYIWSSGDSVVSRVGADHTRRYVTCPYNFRIMENVSHWIPEEAPQALSGPHRIARSPAHTSASEAVTATSRQPEELGHVGQPVDTGTACL